MKKHRWYSLDVTRERCATCGLLRFLTDAGASASPRFVPKYRRGARGVPITTEPPCR